MSGKSTISWTDMTWNPIRGCSRVSEGCRNCYAERMASRYSGPGMPYEGLAAFKNGEPRWTGEVRLIEDALDWPLRKKKPARIFVNSMSDLFHEKVSVGWLDRIFAVMEEAKDHTFQILTKRPRYMMDFMRRRTGAAFMSKTEPAKNIWMGVSVEDQATADERIPLLLKTPATVRWVSYEPALGEVDFCHCDPTGDGPKHRADCWLNGYASRLDWIVVGGESGPGARPFDIAWARSVIEQGKAAGVPIFVKQLGARQLLDGVPRSEAHRVKSRKGGDMAEWPKELCIRQFPGEVGL